jgi:hypothetical protein
MYTHCTVIESTYLNAHLHMNYAIIDHDNDVIINHDNDYSYILFLYRVSLIRHPFEYLNTSLRLCQHSSSNTATSLIEKIATSILAVLRNEFCAHVRSTDTYYSSRADMNSAFYA